MMCLTLVYAEQYKFPCIYDHKFAISKSLCTEEFLNKKQASFLGKSISHTKGMTMRQIDICLIVERLEFNGFEVVQGNSTTKEDVRREVENCGRYIALVTACYQRTLKDRDVSDVVFFETEHARLLERSDGLLPVTIRFEGYDSWSISTLNIDFFSTSLAT